MSEYFPEQKYLGTRVKLELDLSNYATQVDLRNATDVDTSKFAKKVDLVSLKSNVDKLDIDKLKNVPSNLSNLRSKVGKLDVHKLLPVPEAVKNYVVKKDVYNAKIKNIEDNIPNITNLATNTTLNAKTNEVKGEITSITNLATTAALSTVENRIPTVSDLVKREDYDAKKYFTISDCNKFTSNTLDAKITEKS